MASSIALSLACKQGQLCWRSMKTQSALYNSAAEFMITPNAGRSLGPNLGSATRLRRADLILEVGVAALPRLATASTSRTAGMGLRRRPPPVALPTFLLFLK
eukprot:9692194-Alexandrium_andersonii.AAC.1